MTRKLILLAAIVAVLMTSVGGAFAAGTGDSPKRTRDVLSAAQAAQKRLAERPHGGVSALLSDAPYRFLTTTTRLQEKSYWCGPATVQVIDDFHGTHVSQTTIAGYMGTTTAGTDFSKVDDALRYFTGRDYYYYGNLSETGLYSKIEHSVLGHGWPLAIDVNIDATEWPFYAFNHAGHIIPVDGFDWRQGRIRVNDPYDEKSWRAGGGDTGGPTLYDKSVIWKGVDSHFRSAVVSPG